METRAVELTDELRALRTGAPPLLACKESYDASAPLDGCSPAGVTDDQGIYLYLPYFALITGIEDPQSAIIAFEILLFALLVLVSPLIFYGLFGSLFVAITVSIVLAVMLRSFLDGDIYWIGPWCYLLCLPLLALVYHRWERWSIAALAALAGIVMVASFATSIRLSVGLPILLGAFIVLLLRRASWVQMAISALLLIGAYLSIQGWGLDAVRAYRDTSVNVPGLADRYPTQHPLWHNAYLGLGYLPNEYGIEWDDQVGIDTVKRLRPNAQYLGTEYEATLRDEYFRIARQDPGLVIGNMVAKLGAVLWTSGNRSIGIAFAFIPLLAFLRPGGDRIRRYLLIALPAFVLSLVPPLLTMPAFTYFSGWGAVLAYGWLIGLGWLLTSGIDAVRSWVAHLPEAASGGADWAYGLRSLSCGVVRAPVTWVTLANIAATVLLVYVVAPRIVAAFSDQAL